VLSLAATPPPPDSEVPAALLIERVFARDAELDALSDFELEVTATDLVSELSAVTRPAARS
jgi:hypothetical protein